MKTIFTLILSVLLLFTSTIGAQDFRSIAGKVQDASSKKGLGYASIRLLTTNISNVTNSDGQFILNIPSNVKADTLLISYMGYKSRKVALDEFKSSDHIIKLNTSIVTLRPITIRPNEADILVKMALNRIENNYGDSPKQMTAFYREMIKKGNSYVSINEAILDINKSPYINSRYDQIGVYKARGNYDENRVDTIMVKFQGGPVSALEVDVMKSPFLGVETNFISSYYTFKFLDPISINNKSFYVVEFNQKENFQDIYYRGKIYIESESLAIGRVEFNFNVEGRKDANSYFVRKKPASLKMNVVSAYYVVNYKEINNQWYFDYSKTEVKFQVKWDKKWFHSNYSINSELAVTDISDNIRKIESIERFRSSDLISKKVKDFTDQNFWDGYNIIEPDQSIENIISRIIRQLKRRNQ